MCWSVKATADLSRRGPTRSCASGSKRLTMPWQAGNSDLINIEGNISHRSKAFWRRFAPLGSDAPYSSSALPAPGPLFPVHLTGRRRG